MLILCGVSFLTPVSVTIRSHMTLKTLLIAIIIHSCQPLTTTHCTNFIQEKSNDLRKMVRFAKILFDQDTDLTFQEYRDSTVLSNDIGNFFVRKIERIRTELYAVAIGSDPHS